MSDDPLSEYGPPTLGSDGTATENIKRREAAITKRLLGWIFGLIAWYRYELTVAVFAGVFLVGSALLFLANFAWDTATLSREFTDPVRRAESIIEKNERSSSQRGVYGPHSIVVYETGGASHGTIDWTKDANNHFQDGLPREWLARNGKEAKLIILLERLELRDFGVVQCLGGSCVGVSGFVWGIFFVDLDSSKVIAMKKYNEYHEGALESRPGPSESEVIHIIEETVSLPEGSRRWFR